MLAFIGWCVKVFILQLNKTELHTGLITALQIVEASEMVQEISTTILPVLETFGKFGLFYVMHQRCNM